MKRCAQGDLTGILDFYQLVINETEDILILLCAAAKIEIHAF